MTDDEKFALRNAFLAIENPRERMEAVLEWQDELSDIYVDAWGEALSGWPRRCDA